MRFEAKSEAEAVERAARELQLPPDAVAYRVVRDEKSFWGGRIVEIEAEPRPESGAPASEAADPVPAAEGGLSSGQGAPAEPAPTAEAFAAVEATLAELLSAAGLLVEIRRRPESAGGEMVLELIGDDVEPLLANRGEGLNGLEVLAGRIASRRLGQPVHPRLDAEGFRTHQKESLEELAHASAAEAKRTRRPQLLPPLSPGERRLVHLALAADPEVETESEGKGFLKRVAVRPK